MCLNVYKAFHCSLCEIITSVKLLYFGLMDRFVFYISKIALLSIICLKNIQYRHFLLGNSNYKMVSVQKTIFHISNAIY